MFKKALIFVSGAITGSVVTALIVRKYAQTYVNEQIKAMKDMYENREGESEVITETVTKDPVDNTTTTRIEKYRIKPDLESIAKKYTTSEPEEEVINEVDIPSKEDILSDGDGWHFEPVKDLGKPYVIEPSEFGAHHDNYDETYMTYYSDGVLADEDGNPITDIDYMIGEESLNHFGEYEEDIVQVRNDNLKMDIEIERDDRTYAQAVKSIGMSYDLYDEDGNRLGNQPKSVNWRSVLYDEDEDD